MANKLKPYGKYGFKMTDVKTKQDGTKFITSNDGTDLYINMDNSTGASLAEIYAGELKTALLNDPRGEEPGLRRLQTRLKSHFTSTSSDFESPETRVRPSAYGEPDSQAFKIANHVNEVIDAHREWNTGSEAQLDTVDVA